MRIVSGLVVATTLIFFLALSTTNVQALAVQTTNKSISNKTATQKQQAPQVMWQWTGVSQEVGEPFLDKRTNQLYTLSASGILVMNGTNGGIIKNVETSHKGGRGGFAAVGESMLCANRGNFTCCYDRESLSLIWAFDAQGSFSNTPLYVPSKNALYVANMAQTTLYRLDAATGVPTFQALLPGSWISANPVYSAKHNMIFLGDSGYLTATDADAGYNAWSFYMSGRVVADPTLSEDESVVYFGVFDATQLVFALAADTGNVVWTMKTPNGLGVLIKPLLHNGVLYYASDTDAIFAVNPTNGKTLWTNSVASPFDGVDVGNSHVYGDVIVFPNTGIFAQRLDGTGVAWSLFLSKDYVYFTQPPTEDGVLYLGTSTGKIIAVQLPPKE